MKVVGFTFVRNGIKYDYPFLESIQSLLPLCDTVVVAVGRSEDDTLRQIQSLHSPKIHILETIWDDSLRSHGSILSQQTNLALDHTSGDWAFYLQADEILHEKDYSSIQKSMEQYKDIPEIEGLLFRYYHFYGSYSYIGNSRQWYRREIRIVRPSSDVRSWGDAQGFRIQNRKLHVKLLDASIYHYGWVKSPAHQQLKQQYFNKLWHPDEWIEQHVGSSSEYDYQQCGVLNEFQGTHPSVMHDRIKKQNWVFHYDKTKVRITLKERILRQIESLCGRRIGEYQNYTLV